MKNSTFSLSPALFITLCITFLLSVVLTKLDWNIINDAIATHCVHRCDTLVDNTALNAAIPADLIATHIYVLDESLKVAIDTANYTFAVYDDAGVSGGCIDHVYWTGDTCNVNVGDSYVFSILGDNIVFAGEK